MTRHIRRRKTAENSTYRYLMLKLMPRDVETVSMEPATATRSSQNVMMMLVRSQKTLLDAEIMLAFRAATVRPTPC